VHRAQVTRDSPANAPWVGTSTGCAAASTRRDSTSGSTSCPARSTWTRQRSSSTHSSPGRVLWFDALIGNVDRSWRNPNLLFWHGWPYLIDHGAPLAFHHNWAGAAAAVNRPYDAAQHALLGCSPDVAAAARHRSRATRGGAHGLCHAPRGTPRHPSGLAGESPHGRRRAQRTRTHRPDWLERRR